MKIGDYIRRRVDRAVRAAVDERIPAAVDAALRDAIGDDSRFGDAIAERLGDEIPNRYGDQIASAIRDAADEFNPRDYRAVDRAIRDAIGDYDFGDAIANEIGDGGAIERALDEIVPDAVSDESDAIRGALDAILRDRIGGAIAAAIPDAVAAALDPDRDLPFADEIPADGFVLEFADQ